MPRLAAVSWRSLASLMIVLCGAPSAQLERAASGAPIPLVPVGPFLDGALPAGTPDTELGRFILADAYPNLRFDDPLTFTPEPGSNRVFVGSMQGLLEVFENDPAATSKSAFLDLTAQCAVVSDGGFLGHAFHPEWDQPGSPNRNYFYVFYCFAEPGTVYPTGFTAAQNAYFYDCYLRLSRFTRPDGWAVADPASELVLFNIELYNGSHRGGGMFFGSDGFLYCSIGDQFRFTTAQELTTNFEGGVIRIDVDRKGGSISHPPRRLMGVHAGSEGEWSGVGYYIPSDNPFLDPGGGVFEEFWTLGHRAPHRMTLDTATQRVWSGEVGWGLREEVNVIEAGANYQWPHREGNLTGPYPVPPSPLGLDQPPVIDFERIEANAIIGGYVYRGTEHPSLFGRYLCGDYGQQRVWALDYDPGTNTATKEYLLNFTPGSLCTFGQDHQGEVYLCGLDSDTPIYKLGRDDGYPEAPQLLSQVGVFSDLTSLTPHAALIPYDVNTSLWTDGVLKQRWFAVPNDGTPNTAAEQIAYDEIGEWGFPEGSVLVKHFETPEGRRLETRLFVHGETGWYGLTYRWSPGGLDAQLLTSSLQEEVVIGGAKVDYYYPSRSDCLTCHNQQAGSVLGIKTRQLNSSFDYPGVGAYNQLLTLDDLGLLSPPIEEAKVPLSITNAPLHDASASIELRVRSYLDANCAQCHRPGQGRATIDARTSQALPWQGIVDGGVLDELGIPGARVVAPGDPSRSILYKRLNSNEGCCAMPPLGRGLIDQSAVALVRQWISSLDPGAVEGSVGQSTVELNGPPENAIDVAIEGQHNSGAGPGPTTHTANEFQPWWDADLGASYDLEKVRLWNRTDCCGSRLSDFYVFLSGQPFTGTTVAASLAQPGVTAVHYPGTVGREDFVQLGAQGRYLRVQLVPWEVLSLAEVQPYGYTSSAGVLATQLVTHHVPSGADDAEQPAGSVAVIAGSSELEMCDDGNGPQLVGLRFSLDVPAGAWISSAHIQFTAAEASSGPAQLTFEVDDSDDAPPIGASFQKLAHTVVQASGGGRPTFEGEPSDGALPIVPVLRTLSGRLRAPGRVPWTVPDWTSAGDKGPAQRTPDLGRLLQAIVNRPGWRMGNHVLVLVSGTGTRTAEASEGIFGERPRLTVEYAAVNVPPIVEAGPNREGSPGVPVTLLGTVHDEDAGSILISWTQTRGPSAAIADSSAAQTEVTCPWPGDYRFQLQADDGQYVVSDEVRVTVTRRGPARARRARELGTVPATRER